MVVWDTEMNEWAAIWKRAAKIYRDFYILTLEIARKHQSGRFRLEFENRELRKGKMDKSGYGPSVIKTDGILDWLGKCYETAKELQSEVDSLGKELAPVMCGPRGGLAEKDTDATDVETITKLVAVHQVLLECLATVRDYRDRIAL